MWEGLIVHHVTIPPIEIGFNAETNEFIYTKKTTLQLEHSLVSLSKWESKWHKPFLSSTDLTNEETLDYIRCMTITQNVDPNCYLGITDDILDDIIKYIDNPMTATWFSGKEERGRLNGQIVTNEIIYYWMVTLNIPFQCEKWHLNRLLTLIRVINSKNGPQKKMTNNEQIRMYHDLNEMRKKKFNTRG